MTYMLLSTGRHIYHKFQEALECSEKHRAVFTTFSSTFPDKIMAEWSNMVVLWQNDKDAPDLFDKPTLDMLRSLKYPG